jgi:ferredoxin--NADP+ reductase
LYVPGRSGLCALLPIVEAMHKAGNRVIVVLAARSKDLVILEEQMKANSDEVIVMTMMVLTGKRDLLPTVSKR